MLTDFETSPQGALHPLIQLPAQNQRRENCDSKSYPQLFFLTHNSRQPLN